MKKLKVFYLQYSNPGLYPPLAHSSKVLARNGCEVRFLGTGARGDADAIDLPPQPNVSVIRTGFVDAGWRQKVHFAAFTLKAIWMAAQWRPHWIYVSDPFACVIAIMLRQLGLNRIIYHEHDTPDEKSPAWRSFFMRWIWRARGHVARSAAACVLPTELRKPEFLRQTRTERPIFIVWNCPARDEVRATASGSPTKFVVFYHGTLVPSRLPPTVLQALARLPHDVVLRFAGYDTVGYPGYSADLLSAARAIGVEERVDYLGALNRSALLDACAEAHAGLSLMPMSGGDFNQLAMVGASNKAFDYLACGVPVIVSELPDWTATYVATGYGVSCNPNDADSIATAIGSLCSDRDHARRMGERGRVRILEEWNYESQFDPVKNLLMSQS